MMLKVRSFLETPFKCFHKQLAWEAVNEANCEIFQKRNGKTEGKKGNVTSYQFFFWYFVLHIFRVDRGAYLWKGGGRMKKLPESQHKSC